jgi:hypothetical protein
MSIKKAAVKKPKQVSFFIALAYNAYGSGLTYGTGNTKKSAIQEVGYNDGGEVLKVLEVKYTPKVEAAVATVPTETLVIG